MPVNIESIWRFLGGLGSLIKTHRPSEVTRILEYGSGHSTITLFGLADLFEAELFVTIEEYDSYLKTVVGTIKRGKDIIDAAAIPGFEPATVSGEERNKLCYSSYPLRHKARFDVQFVDGRTRAECLMTAAMLSSKDGIVLLHDYLRVRYDAGRYLFDIVDSYMGFQVLKRKAKFDFLSMDLLENTRNTDYSWLGAEVEGNLFAVAEELERERLASLFDQYLCREAKVVEWAADDSTAVLLESAKHNKAMSLYSIYQTPEEIDSLRDVDTYGLDWIAQAVSLIGQRGDRSRDENLHYSSAPVSRNRAFDLIYVGGNRRNECLLTSALVLKDSGYVILRDGDRPHYTVGRLFFDEVEKLGSFSVLRRKKELMGLSSEFLADFLNQRGHVNVTPAKSSVDREKEKKKLTSFLSK